MSDQRDIVERLSAISSALSASGFAGCDARAESLCHEAASEIARLREERRWVPVGDRLPRFGRDVLAATEPFEDGSRLMEVGSVVKCKWSLNGIHGDFPPVTHWMPLPPGPDPKEANRE